MYLCRDGRRGLSVPNLAEPAPYVPYVCVLGSDPEAPKEVQGLIGLTPDELGLCQSLNTDLAFIFAWLERGDGAGGGGVVPRQPSCEE